MTTEILNMRADVENPQTGIDDRKQLAGTMAACLSDSYLLMVKTQGFHWNAVGPLFNSIHTLTEDHYENLFTAIDELAERIRALGYPAPSSITEMIGLSTLQESTENPTAEEMLKTLIEDHSVVARRFRESVERSDKAGDVVTSDMLTERIKFHEKAIWMLNALTST